MTRRLIYIIMCIVALASCTHEATETPATAVLELELSRAGRPIVTTRAVDADLTVSIYKADGSLVQTYEPGSVPQKILLEPGTFRLRAYTDNQTTWASANSGKGEGCYFAETTFEMENDKVFRLKLDVPMTNYAVGLALPDNFDALFKSYTFTLTSGSRTVTITQGEKAYFNLTDGGFTYSLRATNTDNVTHSHSAISFPDIEAGKLFTIRYSYASSANSGGVDIVITDDMETDDTNIHL